MNIPTPIPPADAYCVALTGPTFDTRDQLKKWGFHWNPDSRTWNRLVRDPGAAKNLARHMRKLGYTVAFHPARDNEIKRRPSGEILFSTKKLVEPTAATPGKARGYYGITDFSVHHSGGTHGWSRKRRRR